MRIGVRIEGDPEAVAAELLSEAERAVTAGMVEAGGGLKRAWRAQVEAAGLGRRLANTIRSQVYPRDEPSLRAAALVWTKAPKIVGAHEEGALIRSANGFWLAIPTRIARKSRGVRARALTPGEWERANNRRLVFVYKRGGASMLVDIGGAPLRDRVMGRGGNHRAARRVRPRFEPIFFLVPQAKLPKRLDIASLAAAAAAGLPGAILKHWRERAG